MQTSTLTKQSPKELIIFNFWENINSFPDLIKFKLRNNKIIFYMSGNFKENIENRHNSDNQKEKRLLYTTIIEKNSQTFNENFLFCDSKNFSPDVKIHHIIPNPKENSIDYIYSDSNLNYMQFSSTSMFREEFVIRKNRIFKKIIWNKLDTNKLIGINLNNTIELIDMEKLNDEFSFHMGDALIRDVTHLERGILRDMLIISGETELILYDPRKRNLQEIFNTKENLTQLYLSDRSDTEIIGFDEKNNSTLIFDLKNCNVPIISIKHPKRKLKKQIWSKNYLFTLFQEESCLYYHAFGNDTYRPYDTSLLCNIKEEFVIDDFQIISDEMNNTKCMIVTKNYLKVLDVDV